MPLRQYEDGAEEQLDERERASRLREPLADALRRLSPTQREAVILRVVGELPYSAIAGRLNCSEAAARIRVMRALNTVSVGARRFDMTLGTAPNWDSPRDRSRPSGLV